MQIFHVCRKKPFSLPGPPGATGRRLGGGKIMHLNKLMNCDLTFFVDARLRSVAHSIG